MNCLKLFIRIFHLWRDICNFEQLSFESKCLNAEGVQQARKQLAEYYVPRGVLKSYHIAEDGCLKEEYDPFWPNRSLYFGVYKQGKAQQLYVSARMIFPEKTQGIESMQLLLQELEPESLKFLKQIDSTEIIEFASLIKSKDAPTVVVLELIRDMLEYSIANGIKWWIWGMNPKLCQIFKSQFGSAIRFLGKPGDTVEPKFFQARVIPCLMDIEAVVKLIANPGWKDYFTGRAMIYAFINRNMVSPNAESLSLHPTTG